MIKIPTEVKQKLINEVLQIVSDRFAKKSDVEKVYSAIPQERTDSTDYNQLISSIVNAVSNKEKEYRLDYIQNQILTGGLRDELVNEVKHLIPTPKNGEKGESGADGKDYILTDKDRLDIASKIDIAKLLTRNEFSKIIARLTEDIKTGKLKPPNAGISGKDMADEITKYLSTDLWKGPTQTQIDQITQSLSTGLVYGMELSINTDTSKFNISAGCGYIVDNTTNPDLPTVVKVDLGETLGISVDNIATQLVTYISVNSSGSIVQETDIPDETDRRLRIFIGVIVHTNNTSIEVVNNTPTLSTDTDAQLQDLMNSLGLFNIDGNTIHPNNGNLSIDKSDGNLFRVGGNFQTLMTQPHRIHLPAQEPVTGIQYRTQDGTTHSSGNFLDPGFYDVSGVRTALTNNTKATLQRIYIFPSGIIRVQYGQTEYSNIAEAVENSSNDQFTVEQNLQENALLLTVVAIRGGATNLSDPDDAVFLPAGKWGDISNTGSTAVGTFQQVYKNSIIKPQIQILSSLGAVEFSDENDTALEVSRHGKISAGNYSAFEPDGTLVSKGEAVTWDDINVGGVALRTGAANQPTLVNFNTTTILVYEFSPSQANELHGNVELLHDYKEGTNITPHIHWYPTNTNTGNVVWGLEYTIQGSTGTIVSGTGSVIVTASGTSWLQHRDDILEITGTNLKIGDQIHFRLFRDGANISDTYNDGAAIATFGFHYQIDTLGSRQITTK